MEAKSLQLNVGICKGLPLGGEVLFSNITKCQRAPRLKAFLVNDALMFRMVLSSDPPKKGDGSSVFMR